MEFIGGRNSLYGRLLDHFSVQPEPAGHSQELQERCIELFGVDVPTLQNGRDITLNI
jgi:hypothetical protein